MIIPTSCDCVGHGFAPARPPIILCGQSWKAWCKIGDRFTGEDNYDVSRWYTGIKCRKMRCLRNGGRAAPEAVAGQGFLRPRVRPSFTVLGSKSQVVLRILLRAEESPARLS